MRELKTNLPILDILASGYENHSTKLVLALKRINPMALDRQEIERITFRRGARASYLTMFAEISAR